MPFQANIDVERFERDVRQALSIYRELPSAYRNRVLPPALLAWARIVRDALRRTTVFADKTGRLRRSIRAYRFKRRSGLPAAAFVAAGGHEFRAPHVHLVEFGHGGPNPAPPHPFYAQGLAASAQAAQRRMSAVFRDRALRAARDLIARYPSTR